MLEVQSVFMGIIVHDTLMVCISLIRAQLHNSYGNNSLVWEMLLSYYCHMKETVSSYMLGLQCQSDCMEQMSLHDMIVIHWFNSRAQH